jgi:Fe-S oxidoreductase
MGFNLEKCNFCGICLERCHYSKFTKEECAEELKKLIKGEPTRITQECITCYACNEYCPTGANPSDLILRRMEEQGFTFPPALRHMMKLSDDPDFVPTTVSWGEAGKPIVHTCSFHDLIPHYYEGPLFEGVTFMHGSDFVSRLYLEHIAKVSVFKEGLPKKIENIARVVGGREVVFMHDDCYAAYTTKAMDWRLDVPFIPVHHAEYCLNFLKANKSRIKKLNLKVAYQLPCVSNYTPWQNAWIDEIMELIGCERVKRKYDRDNKLCCGTMVAATHGKEAAIEVKKINIEDAKAAGADVFVLQCPLCALSLREEANEAGMKPYMLAQLCNLALGWDFSGPGAGLGDTRESIQVPIKIIAGEIRELKGS